MRTRLQIGAMSLGILAASIAGCADDNTPSRPEDQRTTGGSAGKSNTSAGATSKGGTTTTSVGGTATMSSGGTTTAAGAMTAVAGAATAATGVGGESNSTAGSTGVGGANSTGGNVASTAGTTATGTGGATSTAGATSKGGTAGATGTSKGGNSTTGGAATVGGTAGKAATGGAPATGGTTATGGAQQGLGGFLGLGGAPTYTPTCFVFVNGATGSDFNEGTSWTDAKATMQAGIDKADQQGGCDVWVAKGIYKPTTSTVRTVSIILRTNSRVFGGFVGTEVSFAQRDFATNLTTLSGDIGVVGTETDNSYSVVTGAQGAILDGFTITGGGPGGNGAGCAIGNTFANMSVSNIVITGNTKNATAVTSSGADFIFRDSVVTANGGGLSAMGARSVIFHSTFAGNSGQALNVSGANTQIAQCSIVDNVGSNSSALTIGNGPVFVYQSEFKRNASKSSGGAVNFMGGGTALFSDCTFLENSSSSSGGAIGQYVNENSPVSVLTLSSCEFSGNTASTFGGAIAGTLMALTAERCSFVGNSATSYAGAVYLSAGNRLSTITNSLFFGNTSGSEGGGAIYLYDGASLKVTNSTVARNTSSIGGAVFSRAVTSKLTMLNSIVWQNVPDQINGGATTATYSINTGNYFSGVGNSGADPLFVAAATGDLRLKTGSPALNAGIAEGAPTVDLLGAARDATPDLGAYEGAASE